MELIGRSVGLGDWGKGPCLKILNIVELSYKKCPSKEEGNNNPLEQR